MCPHGMYVAGMRTKLTEKDGLAGLVLHCRNMKSTVNATDLLIFDGKGNGESHYYPMVIQLGLV